MAFNSGMPYPDASTKPPIWVGVGVGLTPFVCCKLTKFPPQIFGTTEDHFRVFVIDPIPDSIEILNVEVDDLIIHPDYEYAFRFTTNRNDLEAILEYNDLQPTSECNAPSPVPAWWDIDSLANMEAYQYYHSGSLIVTLCYHVPSQTAYYSYFVY